MAASKVATVGVKREAGFLYYLDKQGDVSRVAMARGGGRQARNKPEKVAKAGVKREDGFLYFIDKDGDVARTGPGWRACAAAAATLPSMVNACVPLPYSASVKSSVVFFQQRLRT